MKRFINYLSMAVILFSTAFMSCTIFDNEEVEKWDVGEIAGTVFATLNGNVLTISGNGAMKNFKLTSEGTDSPWGDRETSKNIYSIVIESGVTRIGAFPFYGCGGENNFYGISLVISIDIQRFISFDWNSFSTNYNQLLTIRSLYIFNKNPPSIFFFITEENRKDCTLYVPKGSIDAYKEATGWKDFLEIKAIPGI